MESSKVAYLTICVMFVVACLWLIFRRSRNEKDEKEDNRWH